MILRILALSIIVFVSQACSTNDSIAKESQKVSSASQKTEAAKELVVGESVSSAFSKINVQDHAGKIKSFKSYINNKDSVVVFVKPGCVFCESFEAVLDSLKPSLRTNLTIVMDSSHATLKDLSESKKKHPNIKATWLFDNENKFKDVIGVQSFPKFLHISKSGKLLDLKNGLVLPENQDSLKDLPFAEVLQKLSVNSVTWLQSL